jgi:hypothetical protein
LLQRQFCPYEQQRDALVLTESVIAALSPELAIVRRDSHLSFSTPAIMKKAVTTGRNGLTRFAPVRIFAIAYASPRV